jgi:glutamine synthetase
VLFAGNGAGAHGKGTKFLTRGGVFSEDMLDAYVALKMEEVTRFRMTTHPLEFDMYYSL